jgi:hypothetical protein
MEWDTTALENTRWLRCIWFLYQDGVETKVKKSDDCQIML